MKKKALVILLSLAMVFSLFPASAFASGTTSGFSDMPSDWSTKALENAVNNGLLVGDNGKIMPNDNLTRAQMAAIVNRAFGTTEKASLSSYTDVAANAWYYDDMAKAVQMKTFVGSGDKLNPAANITREEAFAVLARAFKLSGADQSALDKFSDKALVSSWAKDGVASLVTTGYVVGSDGQLNPKQNITRAEFAQIMDPIASDVFTTLQRTVVPDAIPSGSEKILPYEISKYEENGYGSWHYGPGIASEKRLDLMPTTYSDSSVTNASRLLKFFAMTDIHISDEETPAQGIALGYKGGLSSGYSPVMMYTTQVLDAAVQTVNALNKKTPIDFGISLGDSINSSQYNELRWFIDILDGKNINPDSGIKDDPIPGPSNDYQDEFKAVGLDKSIPWYMTLGNHDHFWMGSTPVTPYIKEAYVGDTILNMGNPFTDPLGADSRGYYMGSINGSTPNGDIIGAGLVKNFATAPRIVAADPDRHEDIRKEFMNQFFTTTSNPVGHGFTQANVDDDFACYSFEPKSDIPIKVIVLDDTQNENDANLKGYGHGSLDTKRYNWLVSELEKGQAEDKLMIISAHIPLDVEVPGDYMGWSSGADVTEDKLVSKLHEYSNLILWASGHRHINTVTALKSPDASHPELGFWQVETASLRDFPQEFRTFEVVRNTDNTVSIITVDVDPAVKEGSLAELSRKYAVASQQIFKNKLEPMPTGSYNAELVKQLSPEMQAKLQNYGTRIDLTSEKLLQDKKMIDAAKAMQTESGYAADDYTVITLKKGTVIYGMMPGQSAWYTDKESMDKSGNSYKELYRGMQIAPHPTYGYRTKLASYEVLEDMDVAFGKCLVNKTVKIADVEVTLGEGGYTQFVVPDFANKLKLLETIDLNDGVSQ